MNKKKIFLFWWLCIFVFLIIQNLFWKPEYKWREVVQKYIEKLYWIESVVKLNENCFDVLWEEIRLLENWYTVFPEQYQLPEDIKKDTKEKQIEYCNNELRNSEIN